MLGAKEIGVGGVSAIALAYAAGMYVWAGPEVGVRMGKAHEMAHCQANYVAWLKQDTAAKLKKLKMPTSGVELRMIESARNSPFFKMTQQMSRYGLRPGQRNPMNGIFGGLLNPGTMMETAASAAKAKHYRLMSEYKRSVSSIRDWAKLKASKASDVCEESIVRTVGDTQQDWAIYAGSFGLIQPPGVKNFRANIKRNLMKAKDDA